ncbi:MAG: hypothetical protein GY841_02170 [FCB group bacterium]|nr:hypothetical protein [FCB group bacterium]
MTCKLMPIDLTLIREFVVAGGRTRQKRNYVVILNDLGLGEAAGSVHYGASAEKIESDLIKAISGISKNMESSDLDKYLSDIEKEICPPAMCALSTAWHDYKCKSHGQGLYADLGLPRPYPKKTSITASVGDRLELERLIAAEYGIVKVKMDADTDDCREVIRLISSSEDTRFRIDANGSWTTDDAKKIIDQLPVDRIELIEQPFAADDKKAWLKLREMSDIPLFMDESIVTADDMEKASNYIDGVNIKIQKSGRLETAVEAMRTALKLNLRIMLGCMIESSVGIAAAYNLSGPVDYIDLDGRLLVEGDPFTGLEYSDGLLNTIDGYGHGVSLA